MILKYYLNNNISMKYFNFTDEIEDWEGTKSHVTS